MNTINILQEARRDGYCIGAFNFVDYLTLEAVVEAANERNRPVIAQVSSGTIDRFGTQTLVELVRAARKNSSVPVCLHLDHGKKKDVIRQAILDGFDSVMFDGSSLPLEENVAQTKEIVDFAHERGVSVEGEIGVVAGVEDDIVVRQDAAIYTTPEEAFDFQKRSGVDFLAAAIGTAHGLYKTRPRLNIDTLRTIAQAVDYPLVVHGGTGLSDDVIEELVRAGAAKFNVSTQLKHTYTDAFFGYVQAHRDEYNILKTLENVRRELVCMIGDYIDKLALKTGSEESIVTHS